MRGLKITLGIFLVALVIGGGVWLAPKLWHRLQSPQKITAIVTPFAIASPSPTPKGEAGGVTAKNSPSAKPSTTPTPTPLVIPTTINLEVPFTVQAPTANWDEFHEETCEEAAILMAQWFAFGKKGSAAGGYSNLIPTAQAEKSMSDMVSWERNNLSNWQDTTAEETMRIAKAVLGMKKIALVENPTANDFRRALASGKIVAIPAAGQLLGNPYFKQPGPPYHMLVLRGYTPKGFITNDPGTRHGEGYVYSEKVIMNALHDWSGSKDTIESGLKFALIVEREP